MFLRKNKRPNGKTFLSIAKGYRDPATGKSRQVTKLKIGYLEDLIKDYDDPIAHFEALAKTMTREEEIQEAPLTFSFLKNEKLEQNANSRKNLGFSILSHYYHGLELDKFMINRQRNLKINYSLNEIFQFLTYSRVINSCSIHKAYQHIEDSFLETDFSLDDAYRALSYFSKYRKDLLKFIDESIRINFKRDITHTFYDVTNYYFEINEEDVLRKRGCSKQRMPKPIIQMGLLLDNNGIPLTYRLFKGNTTDCETYLPVLDELKEEFNLGHTIVVADKGMNTGENMCYNIIKGDGYIFSQSVRGAKAEMKEFVTSDEGYANIGEDGFRIKSRVVPTKVWITDINGKRKEVEIDQKQIAFYSPEYDRRAKYDRAKVLKKANGLLAQNKHVRTTGAYSYITKEEVDLETGEVKNVKDEYKIDAEKIKEQEKYDGYYLIVTSELDMPDGEVIDAYRGLWKIEETFKITKTEFNARPVYVSTQEHIESHFLICFVALLILRLLEKDIENKDLSCKKIIYGIRNFNGTYLDQNYYMFDYYDKSIEEFSKIMGVDLSNRFKSKRDIKNIIAKSKKGK